MIQRTIAFTLRFYQSNKIPRPRDPTMAESFETKLSDDQIKILMDPRGYMSEEEKALESKNQPNTNEQSSTLQISQPEASEIEAPVKQAMEKQYGYKPKGP